MDRALRRRRLRARACAAAAALLAASGCGARWTDEQHAAVLAAAQDGDRNGTAISAEDTTAGASGPRAAVATGTATATASGSGSAGPGAATGAERSAAAASGDAAALPCSAPSEAPGVSDTEITLGVVDSLSGPVPGLGASHLAATQAYVDYRNASGGVCGRQLRLLTADDGADNGRNRSIVSEFSSQVLGLLAGVAAGSDGGAEIVDAERIPVVGIAITPGLERSPTYYGVRPALPSYDVVTPKFRYLYDQGVRAAAVVYLSAASAPLEAQRQSQLMRAAGIQVVLEQALPVTTLSYDSSARAVANSGADYLFFVHDQGASAAMARAMADTGHELRYAEYIVAYGSSFVDLAGSAAEGATTWIDTLPTEDGGENPEHGAFLQWMGQSAPGALLDPFASLGWAGAKTLVDSLTALPGAITRDAVLAQLQSTGTYDAGGFLAPIELGAKQGKGCLIGMIVEGGAWRRLTPTAGFGC